MRRAVAVMALAVLTAAAAARAQELDGLPPAVRADLERAFAEVDAHPDDAAALGRLAMLLHAYDQHREAATYYRALRRLESTSFSWAYLSGVVHAALGDHAAAVAAFRDAVRLDGDALAARLRLAEALLEVADLDGAGAEYARLVKDAPELALAHYGLGRVASARGDAARAADHHQTATELSPGFGAAHYALAMAYRDRGVAARVTPHLAAYRQYGNRRPVPPDPLMQQVRAMRGTARELLAEAARLAAADRLADAIAMQLQALALDPRAAQAHVNLISLYGRTGRFEEAERHYRAAIALASSVPDAHYNYGVLLASAQRYEEAAHAFQRALEADPFHAAAHNNLAGLFARRQQYAEAAAHYRQALANDPQHETARLNLGRVLALLGRTAEAIEVLQQALARADRAGQAALAATLRTELQRLGPGR